jgi:hypothetical protein
MIQGPRSPVIMPRAELTWSPVDGSNCDVLLTLDHCGWSNVLYLSVRDATTGFQDIYSLNWEEP